MIVLTLSLPPAGCSPNSRGHWAKKHRAVAEYRAHADAEVRRTIRASQRPRWASAELRTTWYLPDERRRDPDNLMASLKAAIDGLRDGGVLADDNRLVIHPPEMRIDRARPRVELEIRGAA